MSEDYYRTHYVYLMAGVDTETNRRVYKIGFSYQPEHRLNTMASSNSCHATEILHLIPCSSRRAAMSLEQFLHRLFEDVAIGNEWFQLWFIQRVWIMSIESGDMFLSDAEIAHLESIKGA